MSSVHQLIPWAGHINYAAAKSGVELTMKSLAQEVASRHIRVNAIAPGAIRSRINGAAWQTAEACEKLLSHYVTGTTIFVDGGMSLYPAFRDNG